MKIYHLTISVRGRRALARDEAERRSLVRLLTRVAGRRALVFGLADDHLHLAPRTDQPGYLARDLRRVLKTRRPDLELKPPHLEPVESRSYLRWLVRYLLRQPVKHGLATHPALWSGSCFQDLVGARLLPHYPRVALLEELPRFRLRAAFEAVGLEAMPLLPVDDEMLRRAGAARIVDLAAGVFAVGPTLRGSDRAPGALRARSLAAAAGVAIGVPPAELARYLDLRPRSVRRLAREALDPIGMNALRIRLALEERVSVTPYLARSA